MRPTLVRTAADLDAVLATPRALAERVALVPTMGALHDGHAALMRRARNEAGTVVTSVFVNPTQFGPGEDLGRYPRTLPADVAASAREGVGVVLAPDVDTVYPEGPGGGVQVDPGPLGGVLEGVVRPTHFRGVLTVVAKLFGMVRPDVAVFGEKDFQQLVLVRRMARDLAMPVRVVGEPVVREVDGLAVSTRNAYLDPGERAAAASLSRALEAGAGAAGRGLPAGEVRAVAERVLAAEHGVVVDYVALTDPELATAPAHGAARLLVAARVGSTRLIDNAPVHLRSGGG